LINASKSIKTSLVLFISLLAGTCYEFEILCFDFFAGTKDQWMNRFFQETKLIEANYEKFKEKRI